ncbi:MAG TPA: YidC/Oxa1 family insertase periplasmic-domain containing protein [Planctomycetota bacterium]
MEKRVVLLVILCVAVFVGWSLLIQAIYPSKPAAPPPPQAPPPAPPAPPPGPSNPPPVPTPDSLPSRQPQEAERISRLSNERVELILTNRGAGVRSGKVRVEGQADMELLREFDPEVPHLALSAEKAEADLSRAAWTVKEEEPGRSVTYLYQLANGVDIEKKFTLGEGSHQIQMLLTLQNTRPGTSQSVKLRLTALTGLEHDSPYRYDYYGNGFVATVLEGAHAMQAVPYDLPLKEGKPVEVRVPDAERERRRVDWFGLRNRYAAAIVLTPTDRDWIESALFQATTQETPPAGKLKALTVGAAFREFQVAAQPHVGIFSLYLGPVRKEELAVVPGAADHMLSYGCWGLFNPIGRLILWLIGVAHQITGNYGWAIILTTMAVRLCLFPLTRKSQTSMARMAELQPKINILRERFADDPQRQQAETMKLFKEEKVNPLSGCFPIMLQLPIFIGLYSVLDISLEFRKAPFLAWIHDLSQPDRLVVFSNPVNLWVTTLHEFNLVPLVMTITWFLQAYFAPRPQDPKMAAQQRMMMFMPVLFGLFCYSLASGLSLYLFVNSLLAMGEQRVIKRFFIPRRDPSAPPGKA